MTNAEIFKQLAADDFDKVRHFINSGYTETAEFKKHLMALYMGLNYVLMQMEMEEGHERI